MLASLLPLASSYSNCVSEFSNRSSTHWLVILRVCFFFKDNIFEDVFGPEHENVGVRYCPFYIFAVLSI